MCSLYSLYTLCNISPPWHQHQGWLAPGTACQQCEPAPPATDQEPGTAPCPLGHSDALGTLRPVTWGTLRERRATGPRYALRTAPWVRRLPGTDSYASSIFARACCMRSCTRRAAARPFSPPSSNRRISRDVAHCKKTSRWWSGSRADKTRSISLEARDSMDSIEIIFFSREK